ncbi:hypothetical protein IOD14_37190 [Streptomyces sp. A2-16]|uniref:hypothetical protein n=1 Tax=Streptomyces sp. A2-16 TaxID=2781734 RepID=UPI001BAE7245|nr:hypothetical protein [Streptomyces sp. A2-16]QUC61956.1 hypothetical protein IOD14_37190 [Streptomyces sp. A2-16]
MSRMDAATARAMVDRTLYQGETVRAFGAARDMNALTPTLVDSSPNFWVAVTESRFIQVGEASGKATSHRLAEPQVLELRKKLFVGGWLRFDPAGLGPELGLALLKVDRSLMRALDVALADRAQAKPLPKESTTYSVEVVKNPAYVASFVGEESHVLVCDTCGGYCGEVVDGEAQPQPDCTACLRQVMNPA